MDIVERRMRDEMFDVLSSLVDSEEFKQIPKNISDPISDFVRYINFAYHIEHFEDEDIDPSWIEVDYEKEYHVVCRENVCLNEKLKELKLAMMVLQNGGK